MNSLSNTLKKFFLLLIFLFSIAFIASLSVMGKYLINTSKLDLRNAMGFLEYEIGDEPTSETMKIFTDNMVNSDFRIENPNLDTLEIRISHNEDLYNEIKDKDILKAAVYDEVRNIHMYDYIVLTRDVKNKEGEVFHVTLAKNLDSEKRFFFNIAGIFLGVLLICILISVLGFEYLLKKINKQLIILENINSNITLENLKIIKPINQFKEFDNIWNSYEQMLKRLYDQNEKQIEFVHNASHELKTPIFIIRGYIDMIKRWGKEDPNIFNEALISIEDETKDMTTLIEKLLFIAKESEIKLNKSEVELSEIIIESISSLKKIYPNLNINFSPVYTIIHSDEDLIKLLIKNLIENAIKYGKNNPIDIYIRTNMENKTILTIKDYGIGMTPDELLHIYDRFFRANLSRSKDIPGHGLGMTIVKRIIKILDINIKISSTINVGTTIDLYLN